MRGPRVYDTILELLPGPDNPTPLVRINRLAPADGFDLYAKLEWMNPFGSVKDRAAWALIRQLEEEGKLGDGRGIVEPTSGNTGLSLALSAAVRGYGMRAVVPNKIPLEKKVLLKLAGAELTVVNDNLCPSPGAGDGSISIAKSHAKSQPDRYAMPNQYENEANVRAHVETTGPEIWRQTEGRITHFFASLGTAGTITGCATYLREQNPNVRIHVVVPTPGHDIPGVRTPEELASTNLFDESLVDEVVEIDHRLAWRTGVELIRSEGLIAGPSSGLIFAGAREVLSRPGSAGDGGVGVMIFCDDFFKYVSAHVTHMPDLAEGTSA